MQEEKFNEQDGNFDQPNVNESLALAGLFRKVMTEERSPKESGTYATDRGRLEWSNDHKGFLGFWAGRPEVIYWMEEVELPSEDEINIAMSKLLDIGDNWEWDSHTNAMEGAKWMRDFVLAATAKDNVR